MDRLAEKPEMEIEAYRVDRLPIIRHYAEKIGLVEVKIKIRVRNVGSKNGGKTNENNRKVI